MSNQTVGGLKRGHFQNCDFWPQSQYSGQLKYLLIIGLKPWVLLKKLNRLGATTTQNVEQL